MLVGPGLGLPRLYVLVRSSLQRPPHAHATRPLSLPYYPTLHLTHYLDSTPENPRACSEGDEKEVDPLRKMFAAWPANGVGNR